MRPRRYLHRRMVRFKYLVHLFYGVWELGWPHHLRNRIEILETQRKDHPDTFFRTIDADISSIDISASVRQRYGTAVVSGDLSEDAFNRKLGLLKAVNDMLDELSMFAGKEWRNEMRSYRPLTYLTRSIWRLNPYLKSVFTDKERIFNDPVRMKEMVIRMTQEPLMNDRRRILMEYAKDGWKYDVDYGKIWKMDATYIRRKRQELASRHTAAELQDLESVLLAPYIHMHIASLSQTELVFLFAMELKMEIDDAKMLVKFARTYGYYIFSDAKRYVLADPMIRGKKCRRPFDVPASAMETVYAELRESGTRKE